MALGTHSKRIAYIIPQRGRLIRVPEQPRYSLDPPRRRQQIRRSRVAKYVSRDGAAQHAPRGSSNLSAYVLAFKVLPRATLKQVCALGELLEDPTVELHGDPPRAFLAALAVEPELYRRAVGLDLIASDGEDLRHSSARDVQRLRDQASRRESAAKSAKRSSGETTATSGGTFFTAGISARAPRMSDTSRAGMPSLSAAWRKPLRPAASAWLTVAADRVRRSWWM